MRSSRRIDLVEGGEASFEKTLLGRDDLALVVLVIFLGSWAAQAVTGWSSFNADQIDHQQATVSLIGYLANPDFWVRTLQNWQSEFLALAATSILAVYLRQRGSTQSKPVGMPHHVTAVDEE
ncbi:MAG TPA: DUF6766 family protein [Gaiellaceae bacterium]|nr:DUF6766 family protein [Gaiellaceae bacterium]